MNFQQGISGLNATSRNLDVIGNNIANAGTVGAKVSRMEFADLYSNALNISQKQGGIGVTVAAVSQSFSQGSITSTTNPLDLAISGNGFFQVKSPADGQVSYTRNGQFKVDRDGLITNNQGLHLMGYRADSAGVIQPGQARELLLDQTAVPPSETKLITMKANLDSRMKPTVQPADPLIDFTRASTYNSATSVNAVDANGKDVVVVFYFQKTEANKWNVYATANGVLMGSGTDAAPAPIKELVFDSTGSKLDPAIPPFDQPILANATTETLDMNNLKIDFSALTQYAQTFGVAELNQDGYTSGRLTSIVVDQKGLLRANFTNGQTKDIGQIELATFANPNGLQPLGGNGWARSLGSGEPVVGTPGSAALGTLETSALEDSNIDLTSELVNMMVAQRIYQANAQTIKTQDQILQTLVNLR